MTNNQAKSEIGGNMREKIAGIMRDNACFLESLEWDDLNEEEKEMFREQADTILTLLKQEIEGVEQPDSSYEMWRCGFEDCRQAILEKLK